MKAIFRYVPLQKVTEVPLPANPPPRPCTAAWWGCIRGVFSGLFPPIQVCSPAELRLFPARQTGCSRGYTRRQKGQVLARRSRSHNRSKMGAGASQGHLTGVTTPHFQKQKVRFLPPKSRKMDLIREFSACSRGNKPHN